MKYEKQYKQYLEIANQSEEKDRDIKYKLITKFEFDTNGNPIRNCAIKEVAEQIMKERVAEGRPKAFTILTESEFERIYELNQIDIE